MSTKEDGPHEGHNEEESEVQTGVFGRTRTGFGGKTGVVSGGSVV